MGDSPAANGQLCELSSRTEIVKKVFILHVSSKGWDGWTSQGLNGNLSSVSPYDSAQDSCEHRSLRKGALFIWQ